MVNVFRQEFAMTRTTMFAWIAALVAVSLLFISIYPAFSHDVEASKQLLVNLPPQVRDMFGLSLETFSNFLGFYAYTFTYVGLAGAVQAMSLGLVMLSRETSAKTTDFLLTKPITRRRIFLSKLASALVVLLITNLILDGATIAFAFMFGAGNFSGTVFAMLCAAFFLVQLIFLGIGILVSQLLRRVKSVIATSLTVVFGFFAIGLLQSLSNDALLRYLTPFKYFDHLAIATQRTIEMKFVVLSLVLTLVALITSYLIYNRHDARSSS